MSTADGWFGKAPMVLFDWNGTLVDDATRALHSVNVVLAGRYRPLLDLDGFRSGFRLPLAEWFRHLGLGEDELSEAEADWNRVMARSTTRLHTGVVELLDALRSRKVTVGIVSAATGQAVHADISRLGLDDVFDLVECDVHHKPDRLVRFASHRAVYVGDTEYDIVSARQAGLGTVAFTGGYRPGEALARFEPDLMIDRFAQLTALLETS